MTQEKKKTKRGRIRQTRTSWQKVFDRYPEMLKSFSWSDRLPEVLHISMALTENDYKKVRSDFHRISDFVNSKQKFKRKFHFNLSHTIKLIREDKTILEEINQTCFKSAFDHLIPCYVEIFRIPVSEYPEPNPKLLFHGYNQILDGRSEVSILCKYMMMQYEHLGKEDAFNIYGLNTKKEIIEAGNISTVMAAFPPSVGLSENFDLEFCQDIWMFNYTVSPFIPRPDSSQKEENHFQEMNISGFTKEFKKLYSKFRKINLLAIYPKPIAEINMGFVARICNLSLDSIEFVKKHRSEHAELLFRVILENFIVASWLLKRKDIQLHSRFRDYSTGRERFFGEFITTHAPNERMKKGGKKIVEKAIKDAGVREIDVATERGDIFELSIAQMAEELWGANNLYYFFYKRSSEVIHGHWRVIAKYHLAKSLNPMQNGLYRYNENPNRFAGLVPAFMCLNSSMDILLTILTDIDEKETNLLKVKIAELKKRISDAYMTYFNKYIFKAKE